MKIKDCYQCNYNHWGLGIGVGFACVHPGNQKYNPKRRKKGEEKNYHNSKLRFHEYPIVVPCEKKEIKVNQTELLKNNFFGFGFPNRHT
jgi:hypothetical protein